MSTKRRAGIVPRIGQTLPIFALTTGLSVAHADELADLRANQELLQRRVDQLAQAGPAAFPAPAGPGGPVMTGSFPRSFVIPGTEVSLRVGGQGVGSVLWYLKGQAVGGALNGQGGFNETYTDGQGGTGNLPSTPLNTLRFGGTTGSPGRARLPMVRYTYPLPYGMSVAVAAENPNADFSGPFGQFGTDTNQIPTSASCAALTQTALTTTTTNAATNITNACLGNAAFFNAAQNLAPDFVLRWRIEQPWGHIQAGSAVRDLTLNDGMFLTRSWSG